MKSNDVTVLVVDDETPIRRFLQKTLSVHDYRVLEAETGAAAIDTMQRYSPDVVILDLGLPDMDGLQVLGKIRSQSAVPILILSARGDDAGKVAALDMGADDYVTKPFSTEELMARIRTALRHKFATAGAAPVFQSGQLKVDLTKRIVSVNGEDIKLPRKEYDILAQLVTHAGRVLTHTQLIKAIWDDQSGVDPQYLRVYVRRIRDKIEENPRQPKLLMTETGVGYRLVALDP
ncbi:MAG: response regulator transcription factor [Rhodospirillaceae bacterium]|nr:response regulator transcription factor [Rhodospirillaceae bacterium]